MQSSPIYMTKATTIIEMAERKVRERKFKEISMPHKSQVFVIDDENKGTVSEAVIYIVDQSREGDISPKLIVSAYFSFINDPECKTVDPMMLNVSLEEDEENEGACKCTFISSNADSFRINKSEYEISNVMGQYLYNTILGLDIALSSKDSIQGSSTRRIKTSKAKGKKVYTDIGITYINKRKYISSGKHSLNHINWDFSFKVRGHWRYFSSNKVGVDRSGDRTEIGRTWINEYTKGKGELRNNVRVIK